MGEQCALELPIPTIDEREIGLHDSTIQQLYGIGLKIEYCLETLGASPDQASSGLAHVLMSLDSVIEALRGRIYELS